MRRILIATDFSDNALHAAQFVAGSFAQEPAHYHLVYVSSCNDKVGKKNSSAPCEGEICTANRLKLQEFQNTFNRFIDPKLHRSDTFFVDLPPAEALRKQVQEHNIDLIVIGCCGQQNLPKLGRFAQDVIIRVQCPFLIVPPEASLEPVKVMAFATNYNNNYHSSVLNTLTEFAEVNSLKLNVLHYSKRNLKLSTTQNANREFLSEFIDDPDAFIDIQGDPLYAALDEYQRAHPIGVLGLLAKNRSFCEQLLFNPTSNGHASVFENQLPILLLHE